MKKRAVSILLTVMMILSLIPTAAFAAQASPELKMHIGYEEQDGTWQVDECTECYMDVFNNENVQFYLHYPDGSTKKLGLEGLSLPSFFSLEERDGDDWYRLKALAAGTGDIFYEVDGETYSIPVTVELPGLGLYSALPICEENLIENPTISSTSQQFYIALSPDMADSGLKLGSAIHTGNSLLDVADIVVSDDATYATVTVTDLTASDFYRIRFEIVEQNGDYWSTWGRGFDIQNDMSNLYWCYMNWDEDSQSYYPALGYLHTEIECYPGDSYPIQFYFGTKSNIEAGKVDPLSMDDLTFPAYMNVSPLEDSGAVIPENALNMETTRFDNDGESTEITYTNGGTEYSIPIILTLPRVGIYSEPTPSRESLIYAGNPFKVTETERTFYACIYVNGDDTAVIDGIDRWYNNDELADQVTVTNHNGQYLSITVKDGEVVSSREYGFRASWHSDRSRGGASVWFELENKMPALMFRHLEWNDQIHTWEENENDPFETSLRMNTGNDSPLQFYYGTPSDYIAVDVKDLTLPTDILRSYKQDGINWIEAIGFEETGVITYTTDKGTTVKMNVRVDQPSFDLYSSPTASKETYLNREVEIGAAGDVFYLVSKYDDRDITGITAITHWDNEGNHINVTDSFDIQIAQDGSYAAIKAKQELPAGGRYELEFTDTHGEGWRDFEIIRTDLPKLSTPFDLSWHREYQWRAESDKDYIDRMGMASFAVGKLTQNRYEIEYYSAEDNYTSPVYTAGWGFGDMNDSKYFSITTFIYDIAPESGTYKFRVRAEGDGTKYRDSDWSELSEAFVYTAPTAQLTAPDASEMYWTKENFETEDGMMERYMGVWPATTQEGAGYYEVFWYYTDENGSIEREGGTFDIPVYAEWRGDDPVMESIHDDMIQRHGNVAYYFSVRVIPADITKYRSSQFSGFSPALDVEKVTLKINQTLDDLINNPTDEDGNPTQLTIETVQQTLVDSTADLRAAMTADQSISGGYNSGTLDLIRELEQKVANNVDQKVDAKNSAPQEIQDIAAGIQMVGATLNFEDKHPETGKTPTVSLVIDKPKKGIIIEEQMHNAVQFSMKLNGAINYDNEDGQHLIVPIVIDMPVPKSINPDFLVVLHQLQDGRIEQLRPYIYEKNNQFYASFVIDSFSDFALVEYNFRFNTTTKNAKVGDSFVITPVNAAPGSEITYYSDNTDVAEVDPATGRVTIVGVGDATIIAVASETDIYPQAEASYNIKASRASSGSSSSSSSSTPHSWIAVEDSKNGKISSNAKAAEMGDTITLTVTPDKGYKLDTLTVLDGKGNELKVTDNKNGTYSYVSPAGKITITATFVPAIELPFADVSVNDWFFDSVAYVYNNGIMAGNGDNTFGPQQELTRAMVAQVLFNLDENSYTAASAQFADVTAGAWYEKAINWAAAEGIFSGYGDGRFGTMDSVTREQLAVILRNYAVSKGLTLEGKADLSKYGDSTGVAFWATEAVEWAVANGILKADNNLLGSYAPASRAEVALAMMNLCEQVMP